MQEIYKRRRPKTFDQIVGNSATVNSLRKFVASKTVPHCILFSGPSGVGKTTMARILKTELECHEIDYKEMNCSSDRGISTTRDIQSTVDLSPMAGACRIWVLDEVHMLTNEAQNSLLKTLEDTPKHAYFFLCTTNPEKLIETLRTRPTPMPMRALTYDELGTICQKIAKKEQIELSEQVKNHLVESAQGSARMLLVLLEKISNLDPSEQIQAIEEKLSEDNEAIDLCRAIFKKTSWNNVAAILRNLKGEPENTRRAVLGYARSVLLKEKGSKDDLYDAYTVLSCFKDNVFDSGQAGLSFQCYEAIQMLNK